LLVFGYLFPSERSPLVVIAYADTLSLRRPWDGVFWLLPVVVGVLLLARRQGVSRNLAGFAVGVLAVAAADVADEIWGLVREDDVRAGIGPPAFLAGIVTAGAWATTNEWRALRRPALLPLATGAGVTLAAWLASPAG
jgi:drug/metabolite transporter (DMT)-like permease